MRTAKSLIRLGGCPGWSESSLGAHSFCWFCPVVAQISKKTMPRSPMSTTINVAATRRVAKGRNHRLLAYSWQSAKRQAAVELIRRYLMTIKAYFCLFLHKNIYCGYSLESNRRGDSKEYPQHMFYGELKKNIIELSSNTILICSTENLSSTSEVITMLDRTNIKTYLPKHNIREKAQWHIKNIQNRTCQIPLMLYSPTLTFEWTKVRRVHVAQENRSHIKYPLWVSTNVKSIMLRTAFCDNERFSRVVK